MVTPDIAPAEHPGFCPLTARHTPFTGFNLGAEQFASFPPFIPAHDQVKVVALVVTVPAVPAEQRVVVGAVAVATPFAVPHLPFIFGAQDLLLPPCIPSHVHVHVVPL